jgi:hypothetical protein
METACIRCRTFYLHAEEDSEMLSRKRCLEQPA